MNKPLDIRIGIGVLILFHIVGLIGLQSAYHDWFAQLTPMNLLLCFALVVLADPNRQRALFWGSLGLICLFGFVLEVIGVNTGVPFGEYQYGAPFGWQWKGTPLLIGINWFLMVYGGALLMKGRTNSPFLDAILAGCLVVLVDLVLEPVAIKLGFWSWASDRVPLQNYLTWWVVVVLLSYLVYRILPKANNAVARAVLVVQFLFFVGILFAG